MSPELSDTHWHPGALSWTILPLWCTKTLAALGKYSLFTFSCLETQTVMPILVCGLSDLRDASQLPLMVGEHLLNLLCIRASSWPELHCHHSTDMSDPHGKCVCLLSELSGSGSGDFLFLLCKRVCLLTLCPLITSTYVKPLAVWKELLRGWVSNINLGMGKESRWLQNWFRDKLVLGKQEPRRECICVF